MKRFWVFVRQSSLIGTRRERYAVWRSSPTGSATLAVGRMLPRCVALPSVAVALLAVSLLAVPAAAPAANLLGVVQPADASVGLSQEDVPAFGVDGPVLAGGDVVFVQRLPGGVLVRRLDSAGALHDVQRIPLRGRPQDVGVGLAGGPEGIALDVSAGSGRYGAIFTGPSTGPLRRLGCPMAGCSVNRCSGTIRLGVSSLAYDASLHGPSNDCRTFLITSTASGSSASVLTRTIIDLHGRWLATAPSPGEELTVSDVLTGAVLYRLPSGQGALDDDGSFFASVNRQVVLASAPTGALRPVSVVRSRIGPQLLTAGGGHFAFSDPSNTPNDELVRLQLGDHRGVLRSLLSPPVKGLAVDAGRMAWTTLACAAIDVEVWDLAGPPPVVPRRCRNPVSPTLGYVYNYYPGEPEDVNVFLRCPAGEPQGCAGRLLLRADRGRRAVGQSPFRVQAGTRALVDFPSSLRFGPSQQAMVRLIMATRGRRAVSTSLRLIRCSPGLRHSCPGAVERDRRSTVLADRNHP